MRDRTKKTFYIVSGILFLIYILWLIYLLFLSEKYGRQDVGLREHPYNLKPFREIHRFLVYWERVGLRAALINLLGNILAFIPFGFFLPILKKKNRKVWKTVGLGFCFSLLIEVWQFLLHVGSFDVDDILLNTMGVALGYLLFACCNLIRRKVDEKKI